MHDPQIVAFEIRRPWPQRSEFRPSGKRWKVGASPFWTLAGREYYWPGLITVWHVDPSGFDSFQDCPRQSKWQWHVHHWKIQVQPLQHLRRWALTRCEWCGGRSRKGDLVNHSQQWHNEKSPWWKGERGLFHADCSTISRAHKQCACRLDAGGPWETELSGCPYGQCATCGKYRGWEKENTPRDDVNRLLQTIPEGHRDPDKMASVRTQWREHRATEASN